MISRRFAIITAFLFLCIFAFLSVTSAFRESLTYDEIVNIQEGKNAFLRHQFVVDTNVPPLLRELAVLPLVFGTHQYETHPNMQVFSGRLIIILFGCLLGSSIFVVSSDLFGWEGALFALFLFTFEPDFLAHSHYITQEVGATLFYFLSYLLFIRAVEKPSTKQWILFGLAAGLMAASKITVVFYFLLSAAIAIAFYWKKFVSALLVFKKGAFFSVVIALLVIWSTYFFNWNVVIVAGGGRDRFSVKLASFAKAHHNEFLLAVVNSLRSVRVPLGDYIAVIKNTLVRSLIPQHYFFLGNFYLNSRWYFMAGNWLLKTPVPLLLFFSIGICVGIFLQKIRKQIIILGIPIVSVLIISSLSGMQPLVRYILPMYPFMIIIAASVIVYSKNTLLRVVLFVLCLWYALATMAVFPHFLTFTNELAGSKDTAMYKFTDSNMDWGQSLISFKEYVDRAKPKSIDFSYFGRDDGAAYGLPSGFRYGGYKEEDICAFHHIDFPNNTGASIIAISLSNWYGCNYYSQPNYRASKINSVRNAILLYSLN